MKNIFQTRQGRQKDRQRKNNNPHKQEKRYLNEMDAPEATDHHQDNHKNEPTREPRGEPRGEPRSERGEGRRDGHRDERRDGRRDERRGGHRDGQSAERKDEQGREARSTHRNAQGHSRRGDSRNKHRGEYKGGEQRDMRNDARRDTRNDARRDTRRDAQSDEQRSGAPRNERGGQKPFHKHTRPSGNPDDFSRNPSDRSDRRGDNRRGGGYRMPKEVAPVYDEMHEIPVPTKQDLLFLPIGGSGEIGMNVNLYGHNDQWIMVDLGITFSDEPYGFDLVTANLDIVKNTSVGRLLKGVIITHAHEDHIGGVHEIWPLYKFHLYMTRFAKEILIRKLEDKPYGDELMRYYVHEIPPHGKVTVGDFEVQYLGITHSIPESNALVIKTPAGTIFHTGDWKLDPNPCLGEATNEERYRQLAKENVVAMVCDSTNAMSKGRAGSEADVAETFERLFNQRRKNRIAVTCFASNVARVKTIADLGRKHGRKVCLLGRSLHKMVESADQCQFPIHADRFISDSEAARLPRDKVMYICTGSQGDELAALMKISRNIHRLKLSEGDAVYFSSKCIPGNERRINILQNNLTRLGVDIITDKDEHIHVSGHPYQDELKEMYEWIKPQCVVPVHGEIRHLHEHAKFAKKCGYDSLIPENGTLIDLKQRKILKRYDIGRMVLDGNRFIHYASSVVKERKLMGAQGVVFLSIKGKFVYVSSHGLVDGVPEEFNKRVRDGVRKMLTNNADSMKNHNIRDAKVTEYVKNLVRHMYNKTPEVKTHWLQESRDSE